MSESQHDLNYSQNVMANASRIDLPDIKKKYAAAAMDFIERQLIRQFAEAFPEADSVAHKVSAGGSKPAVAKLAVGITLDMTNFELLKMSCELSVGPFKLKLEGETSEDLRQLELNYETGTAIMTDSPAEQETEQGRLLEGTQEARGSTQGERYTAEELSEIGAKKGGKKSLRAIAEAKQIGVEDNASIQDLINAIVASEE